MSARLAKSIILLAISFSSLNAQSWSSMIYGVKDAYLHEHMFTVDDYTELRISLVFSKNANNEIKLDTVVSTLLGLTLGTELINQGAQLTQRSEGNTVYWTLPILLNIKGLRYGESTTLKGEFKATFKEGSYQPEVESYIYENPEFSGGFIFLKQAYVFQFFLLIISLFFIPFHRNINRFWLLVVLIITPVIGPSIYILNRLTKAVLFIRNKITPSKVIETH